EAIENKLTDPEILFNILLNYINTEEKDPALQRNLTTFYNECVNLDFRQAVLMDIYNFIRGKKITGNNIQKILVKNDMNSDDNTSGYLNHSTQISGVEYANNNDLDTYSAYKQANNNKPIKIDNDLLNNNRDWEYDPAYNSLAGNIYHHNN
ncbi:hypothetical protein, partial [Campylobacter fetus]|uniref:hypothetical protein n=1 Tax=Campylobacter fetus TaxID=196 RepID=UPI0013016648